MSTGEPRDQGVDMNENAPAWVAALRSGEYRQGAGNLTARTTRGDWDCCLGVACKLAVAAGAAVSVSTHGGVIVRYDGESRVLPHAVRDWLGLTGTAGEYVLDDGVTSLANDNDLGATFAEIADIIESEPPGLFAEEAA